MTSRKKSVDKSSEFEAFIEQTSDYLPPSTTKDNSTQTTKRVDKHSNKQNTTKAIAGKHDDIIMSLAFAVVVLPIENFS